jgi:hypothetical protein
MSGVLLQEAELRAKGFEVLVRELGWVNAVRFIQQYEPTTNNYTGQRDAILPSWDSAEMVEQLAKLR